MIKLVCALLCCFSFTGFGQNTWKLNWKTPIDSMAIWDVDAAKNAYIMFNQTLVKVDNTGKTVMQQSIKSIGNIKKIDAANFLKIAVFSEDQQRICYLDNALAIQSECIDLAKFEVELANTFSTSIQTDRLWVFDQVNSQLQLITLRSSQRQIIQNIKSLVDIGNVEQLIELNNELFLIDDSNKVVRLDNFGTLISVFEANPAGIVQPFETGYLYGSAHSIVAHNYEGTEQIELFKADEEVVGNIKGFKLIDSILFISTSDHLYCFELNQK